jgi:tetrahydromethanopterin S-methyltransferase subunit G
VDLSAHEKRLLDEIERDLVCTDRRFETFMRVGRSRTRSIVLLVMSVTGLVLGATLVALGMVLGDAGASGIAVAGFGIVIGSCWVVRRMSLWHRRGRSSASGQ